VRDSLLEPQRQVGRLSRRFRQIPVLRRTTEGPPGPSSRATICWPAHLRRVRTHRPTLETISLTLKDVLHRPGERIHHVYFPGGGFCSMVTELADGAMVEVATVGREGMLGVSAMWEGVTVTTTTMVQGETDSCYRMPVDAFRPEVEWHGRFAQLLMTFSQALFGSVAESTACNAV
jgi:hypothetical protein